MLKNMFLGIACFTWLITFNYMIKIVTEKIAKWGKSLNYRYRPIIKNFGPVVIFCIVMVIHTIPILALFSNGYNYLFL